MSLLSLCVVCSILAAILLAFGLREPRGWRVAGTGALFLLLALVTAYFAYRGNRSLGSLAQIIEVPEITEANYVPSQREMDTIAKALMAAPVPDTRLIGRREGIELVRNIASSTAPVTHWILRTPLRPDDVRAFYLDPGHRTGWNIEEQSDMHLGLKRDKHFLLIIWNADRERSGGSVVIYTLDTALSPTPTN